MTRILLTTFGSLGDLHPYIALGKALLERGQEVLLGTHEPYRSKVEAEGIPFAGIRPAFDAKSKQWQEMAARAMDHRFGPRFVIRDMIMPVLRESYADTAAAAEGCDLLVSHPLTLSVRLIAETRKKPWAATVLAPLSFFSMVDPPVVGSNAIYSLARWMGPWALKPIMWGVRSMIAGWCRPYYELRRELGILSDDHPMFEGQFSPLLNLALFSKHLTVPQPDWPAKTLVTGSCFYDRDEAGGMSDRLRQFLDAGAPPVVFTLGSSAVLTAGNFYVEAVRAIELLGCRAVLLVGKEAANRLPAHIPQSVYVEGYAPFSELFPRARVIVHQGGAGTTAQAMRAGKPMLVVPWAHDQPDNAERVRRLGVARVLPATRWNAGRAFHELWPLLHDTAPAERAAQLGQQVTAEDGPGEAAKTLMGLLSR